MRNVSNKEKIIQVAGTLFAAKGYENVSMREIASEVGIKASSIYNHYAGKEALLDAIFNYFKEQIETDVFSAMVFTEDMDLRGYLEQNMKLSDLFFSRSVFMDISKIIIREQFRSESSRQLLLTELVQKPIRVYTHIFGELMNREKMRCVNPVLAAKEFHGYFILRFYELCLMLENGKVDMQIDATEQAEHIELFLAHYGIDGKQ